MIGPRGEDDLVPGGGRGDRGRERGHVRHVHGLRLGPSGRQEDEERRYDRAKHAHGPDGTPAPKAPPALLEFAGNYLRLIVTGSWKFWDSARTVSFYSEWNILWPLIFFVGVYKLKINWQKFSSSHLLIWFFILYNLLFIIS